MIDHEYTDSMVCPYCGCEQSDVYEITGAYDDDTEVRVSCQGCDAEFASRCMVTYCFTTSKVDKEAEAREAAKLKAKEDKRTAERYAECAKWPPGTRIRVRPDCEFYAEWLRGRAGVVDNKELSRRNPFVSVLLDPVGDSTRPYDTFFRPEHLEEVP